MHTSPTPEHNKSDTTRNPVIWQYKGAKRLPVTLVASAKEFFNPLCLEKLNTLTDNYKHIKWIIYIELTGDKNPLGNQG